MSRVLPAYLRRRVGVQTVAMLALLTLVQQLLELLEVTTDILERGLGAGGLLHYAVLRTPAAMALALPLAVMLGTVTALYPMARRFEVTAMRASGVSLLRILAYLLPMLALFAAVQFALLQLVLPAAESQLRQWWTATSPAASAQKPRWAYTNEGPVSIDQASADGRELIGVMLYARDASGGLIRRVKAGSAVWDGTSWLLKDVTELSIDGVQVRGSHVDSRPWATNLHPDEVLRLDLSRPYLSSTMIADLIAGARVRSQPISYYQTALYRSFTAPVGIFIMLLLALPTAALQPRASGNGHQIPLALALGLAYLLSDGIAASLGASGRQPPLAMALAAPLAFVLIGIVRVRACEHA